MTINAPTATISSSSDIRYLRRFIYGIFTSVAIYELPCTRKAAGNTLFFNEKDSPRLFETFNTLHDVISMEP
jgi:hypothetical protein